MTIAEQKEKLIERISSLESPVLIEDMMKLIDMEVEEKPYAFSTAQKDAVLIAREQYKNGEYLSHDEASQQSEEWLEE